MALCVICKKDFIKNKKIHETCSRKCSDKNNYCKNKQKYIQRARQWALFNPEKAKASRKKAFYKFYKYQRKRFNTLMIKSYHNNKIKYNAFFRALYHFKDISNIKCQSCKINFAEERHHEDYSKPLEIKLLCKPCHGNI